MKFAVAVAVVVGLSTPAEAHLSTGYLAKYCHSEKESDVSFCLGYVAAISAGQYMKTHCMPRSEPPLSAMAAFLAFNDTYSPSPSLSSELIISKAMEHFYPCKRGKK